MALLFALLFSAATVFVYDKHSTLGRIGIWQFIWRTKNSNTISLMKRVSIVTLKELKTLENATEYLLVVPSAKHDRPLPNLGPLLVLLEQNTWLEAITGHLYGWSDTPYCTADRKDWTISLKKNYSIFANGFINIPLGLFEFCYPCDILPNAFLIKSKALRNKTMFSTFGESALLHLFLSTKGHSAYCPTFELDLHKVRPGATVP